MSPWPAAEPDEALVVPGVSLEAIERLVAFAAPKFQDPASEGQWMAVHLGATGPISGSLHRLRAVATKKALRESNAIPTWRPFLLTRRQGHFLLYSPAKQKRLQGGDYVYDRQAAKEPVYQTSIYRFLGPFQGRPGPRGRLSPLADA